MGNISCAFFMGAGISETVIQTNRPDLPSSLIVADSFTSLAGSLLCGNFNEMRSLNFRFCSAMMLPEHIQLHQPDIVLILLNYEKFLHLERSRKLGWQSPAGRILHFSPFPNLNK